MHRLRRATVALLLVVVSLPPLLAEENEGTTYYYDPIGYLGLRLGWVELEDVDDDGSLSLGVMGGVFFISRLAAEASVDFQKSELPESEFSDGSTNVFPDVVQRETVALQAGLSFMPFPEHQVRPYLLGGVGYYYSKYKSPGLPAEKVDDSGYFAGLGVDLLGGAWNGRNSLVVEARWLFTQKEEYAGSSIRADGFIVSVGYRRKFD